MARAQCHPTAALKIAEVFVPQTATKFLHLSPSPRGIVLEDIYTGKTKSLVQIVPPISSVTQEMNLDCYCFCSFGLFLQLECHFIINANVSSSTPNQENSFAISSHYIAAGLALVPFGTLKLAALASCRPLRKAKNRRQWSRHSISGISLCPLPGIHIGS